MAVLLLGLVAGLVAGTQKSKSDTLTAIEPAAAATEMPAVTEFRAEHDAKVYGAQVRASVSAQAYAVAQAKAKAQLAAKAAREAAAKAKADAVRAEEARKAAAERASRSASRSQPAGVAAPPVPVDCQSYSGNKAIGCSLLGSFGFGTGQMSCLEPLWERESGWNERAANSGSGAYGIPQALPGNKMAKYGSDWETNPVTQVKWGLDYIKGTYGTPCDAWSAFQSKGWY